jgi:hypothetical protein
MEACNGGHAWPSRIKSTHRASIKYGLFWWTLYINGGNAILLAVETSGTNRNSPNFYSYIACTFLIIKPTRCINYSNLFLEWNSTCFGQFLCPSSGVFHCSHGNGICYFTVHTANLYNIYHCCVYSSCQQICITCTIAVCTVKTPNDGEKTCLKHVEFHSKNKFENLVHLVGFIIRNLSRCNVKIAYTVQTRSSYK